jgi:Phage Terminase
VDRWNGEPLELYPPQLEFFNEALAYDEHGLPIWQSVVQVVSRKNGKTTAQAGYALYRLLTDDGSPEILLAAASDRRAGRLFDACAAFVRRSATLSRLLRVRDYVGEIVREDGRGQIRRMSSDPIRLYGFNPTLVVADEVAQWVTPSLERAYAALTSGGGARRAPQVFTISTAGHWRDRHSSILGRLVDAAEAAEDSRREPGLLVARMPEARTLAWVYEAPTTDPRDTAAMKLANPAPWITEDYLARQAANPELSDAAVLQLHGCVWAEGDDTWLPAGVWAGRPTRAPSRTARRWCWVSTGRIAATPPH